MDKVLYELGWNYQDKGEAATGAKYFNRLVQEFPQSSFVGDATYMLAQQQYDSADYANSAQTYQAVLSSTQDPTLIEKATYKLGWSHFQQERFPQAASSFQSQVEQAPNGPLAVDALFMRAECDFKQEQFEAAAKGYQAAREKLEASTDTAASAQVRTLIYLHAAQCFRELKEWEQCETWLKIVLEQHAESPYMPTALYEMGYCKQNQGQVEEALKYYAEVANNYRDELAARSRFMMGEVYFSQRDFVKAIPEFQRVMFGFGGERAPEDIKNWQAKSAFEAARCSEVLLESLKGNGRQKIIQTAQEFYNFIVEKHAQHDLAAKAQTRLGDLKKLR